MPLRRTFCAALLSTVLFSWAIGAQVALGAAPEARVGAPAPVQAGAIDGLIASYKEKGLTDANVLVAKDGAPVFRTSFGLANREWEIPNAPDVEFRISSMTKQFTAMAILQLAEHGKLGLDDPISRFVHDAPPAWRGVTIRHLLTHTSGIPDHTSLPEWGAQTWMARDPEDLIRFLRDRPLDFAPGSKSQYDSAGYVILGFIVQKVSGQSLSDYLSAHVFTPLGMKHTGFVGYQIVPHRASGYEREGEREVLDTWRSGIRNSGAGGIYSTTDDLLTWDQALYEPKRLGLADLRPMFTNYGHGFGFGYVISAQDGHPVWWHNGHGSGFSSAMARYPEDKLTVIVLSNDEGAPVECFSEDLASLYLGSAPVRHGWAKGC
jgi:CubicO group peptidase (beta-lactamase class C family)